MGIVFLFFSPLLLLLVISAPPSRPPLPAPGLSQPACYPPPPVPLRLEAAPPTGLLALPLLANLVFRRGVREQARRSSGGFSNPQPVGTGDTGLWLPWTGSGNPAQPRCCSCASGSAPPAPAPRSPSGGLGASKRGRWEVSRLPRAWAL